MIEIADKWARLPQRPVPLDRSNRLARGLVFAHTPVSGPFETVFNDARGAFGSGVSIAPTPAHTNGIAFTGGQASGAYSWGAAWDRLAGATALTLAIYLKPDSIAGGSFLAKWGGGSNILLGTLMGSGNVGFIAGDSFGNRNGVQTSGGTLAAGKPSMVIWTWALYPNNAVYIDGVPMALSGFVDSAPDIITALGSSTAASLMQLGIQNDGVPYSGAVMGCWMWARGLQQSEALAFTRNPGQLYRRSPVRIYASGGASPDVTLALSGSAATASAGTLAPTRSVALSGSAAAASAGTLTPNRSIVETGTAATTASGALTPSTTIAQTGTTATTASGTISAGGDATAALTGTASTAASGSVTPSVSKALTGSAATSTAGTITPAVSKALAGTAATAAAGTLAPSVTIGLTGTAVTTASGSVSASGPGSTALTGTAATAASGTVAPAVSKALTGSAATLAAGILAPGASKALTGSAATPAAGTLAPSRTIALTGSAAATASGTVTVGGDRTIALTGSAATATAGSIADCGRAAQITGSMLQAFAGVLTPARLLNLVGSYATASRGTITASGGSVTTIDIVDRYYTIPAEDRSHTIPAEGRSTGAA